MILLLARLGKFGAGFLDLSLGQTSRIGVASSLDITWKVAAELLSKASLPIAQTSSSIRPDVARIFVGIIKRPGSERYPDLFKIVYAVDVLRYRPFVARVLG